MAPLAKPENPYVFQYACPHQFSFWKMGFSPLFFHPFETETALQGRLRFFDRFGTYASAMHRPSSHSRISMKRRYTPFCCMWNCKHTIFPVVLGVSEPAHSPEELAAYARNSREAIEIDGRVKTRYEWTQEQRRTETAIRRQKDVANLAKASGDDVLRREAQSHINTLQEHYARISAGAGLTQQPERAAVAGFRRVKTVEQLKKPAKRDILSAFTEAGGGDVQFLCRIDRRIYSCVTEDITTDEVVITNERIEHIKDHHPKDYEQYLMYITQILQEPDYILENEPNTALVLKEFKEDDRRFRLVLRLKTSTDNPEHKNSVLTFMKTNEKKWGQNLRNKKILSKRGI